MTSLQPPARPYSPPAAGPDVLYTDDWLVIANKPTGLLSVPGRGEDKQDCAISRLSREHGELHTVHRLDMDTSGLIVFARHPVIASQLFKMFREQKILKAYLAVVHGHFQDKTGEISLPIGRDWEVRPRRRIDTELGKPALTRWFREREAGALSQLRLEPVTGRTHQLRLHMAATGHPVAGDQLYGRADGFDRLCLHACELRFCHPQTGREMTVTCPAPFHF